VGEQQILARVGDLLVDRARRSRWAGPVLKTIELPAQCPAVSTKLGEISAPLQNPALVATCHGGGEPGLELAALIACSSLSDAGPGCHSQRRAPPRSAAHDEDADCDAGRASACD
jgi:hypothetical protein